MPHLLLVFVPVLVPILVSPYAVQGHLRVENKHIVDPTLHSIPIDHNVNAITDSMMSFEVLQYNVFGRPDIVSKDGQSERLQRIPQSLYQISQTIDIVTLAEANVHSQVNDMLARFRTFGFKYSTTLLHDPDPFSSLIDGGEIVVSKWPIIREAQHVYHNACYYSDCLAAKGVKYARLLKTVNCSHKVFNVFATYTQAWSTLEGQEDRIKQAKQMRQLIDRMGIPHHEPLIFAGDFNVDNHTFQSEVAHLRQLLQAHVPHEIGKQRFTSIPQTNVLVGRDGAADSNNCSAQYIRNWGPVKNNVFYPSLATRTTCEVHTAIDETNSHVFVPLDHMCYCPCCPLEWLDYVLYGQAPYQQPTTVPTRQAFVNQVPQFTAHWTASTPNMEMALIDLSDHYPVLSKFEFSLTHGQGKDDDSLTYHLNGCSSDNDCHFRSFHCYCNGLNCYFNGHYTNGWNLDSQHPVNRNCLYEKTSFAVYADHYDPECSLEFSLMTCGS